MDFEARFFELFKLAVSVAYRRAPYLGLSVAEEIAQEVMIKAWKNWPIEPNPRGWVKVAATFKAIELVRNIKFLETEAKALRIAEPEYYPDAQYDKVVKVLPLLVDSQREVISNILKNVPMEHTPAYRQLKKRAILNLRRLVAA